MKHTSMKNEVLPIHSYHESPGRIITHRKTLERFFMDEPTRIDNVSERRRITQAHPRIKTAELELQPNKNRIREKKNPQNDRPNRTLIVIEGNIKRIQGNIIGIDDRT